MRVTKAIREYVEDEVYKKYKEAEDNIGKEYNTERQAVLDHVVDIMYEAGEKALDYIKQSGFEYRPGYRENCIFNLAGSVEKKEMEAFIGKEYTRLRNNRDKKVKQILFDLEMGETEKAELKSVLDSVTIE